MTKLDKLDIHDKITRLATLMERLEVLSTDIEKGFVTPMDFCDKSNVVYLRILAETEAHEAAIRLDMLADTIDDANVIINELEAATIPGTGNDEQPAAEAASNDSTREDTQAADATEDGVRQQMIEEYMETITMCVSLIEQRPDFIKRMLELRKAAMLLASGFNDVISDGQAPM